MTVRVVCFLLGALAWNSQLKGQTTSADLKVSSITASPTTPAVNTTFTYTVGVLNGGPNGATGVTVTQVLPPGVTFVSGAGCSAVCDPTTRITVTCSVGSLSGSTNVVLTVTAPSTVGTIRTVAGVAGNEYDPVPANNSTWVDTTVGLAPAPGISGLSVSSATTNGGTQLTVFGSNFVSGASVKFGGAPGSNVVFNSPSQIKVTTPGHVAGSAPVRVTNPDGQISAPFGFTFNCPSILINTSLPSGIVSSPYSQTVSSSGGTLPYSYAVTNGSLPAGLTLTPGGLFSGTPTTSGLFSFTISSTDSWNCVGSRSYSLTISQATLGLTSLFPTFGPAAGGSLMTIYGTGFQSGATLKFGSVPGVNPTWVSSTVLQVTTPSGTGSVDVIVTNPNLETQRLTNGFTYGGIKANSLPPCRVLDTRGAAGPYGGPALNAGGDRPFVFAGRCGIPSSAKAVIINVAVTGATSGPGHLSLYPGGMPLPLVSTINYSAGQTRANNAIVPLGPTAGDISTAGIVVHCGQGAGTVHIIVDVSGYLQ